MSNYISSEIIQRVCFGLKWHNTHLPVTVQSQRVSLLPSYLRQDTKLLVFYFQPIGICFHPGFARDLTLTSGKVYLPHLEKI